MILSKLGIPQFEEKEASCFNEYSNEGFISIKEANKKLEEFMLRELVAEAILKPEAWNTREVE